MDEKNQVKKSGKEIAIQHMLLQTVIDSIQGNFFIKDKSGVYLFT